MNDKDLSYTEQELKFQELCRKNRFGFGRFSSSFVPYLIHAMVLDLENKEKDNPPREL